jgi:glyoxylase I family protein
MSGFGIVGLDHVVVRARDLERMVAFYRDAVGCIEERRVEKLGLVQMRAGRSMIDLVAGRGPETAGNMDHLCLRIEPFDAAAIRARFAQFGVEIGEVVSRYGAEGDGPSVYLNDPEGNVIELKGPPGAVT